MYVPITKYPWGGSFCLEAFAEAKLTGSGLKFRLWCCEKHPRCNDDQTKQSGLLGQLPGSIFEPLPRFYPRLPEF